MPWLALDFQDRQRKAELSAAFGVKGIPSLVIVDGSGKTITKDGRSAIASDPIGDEFPWHPKPVSDLKNGAGALNDLPSIVAFCEGAGKDDQRAVSQALTKVSQRYVDEQTRNGDESPRYAFMTATQSGQIADRLRGLMRLPKDETVVRLFMLDMTDDGAYYEGPEGHVSAEAVEKFISDFEARTLARQQLAAA